MHEKVACTGCHVKPIFTDVGKDCANCHADIHRGQFGANCAQCHTVNGWQVSVQAISQHFNRFPLLGAHAVVQCDECHKNAAAGDYLGLSTACESCHMSDFQQTTNPPHQTIAASSSPIAADFKPSNCQNCHNFDSFGTAVFSVTEHAKTGFLLQGAHATTACALCHINNNYNLTITQNDCGNSQCHLTTWQQTNNPVHPSAGPVFAAALCVNCHTSTVSWNVASFDHSTTGFLLTQGHASLQCAQCHINNNYTLTIAPTDCGNSQCHLTTWQQTTTPVHSTSGTAFAASNCATCHTTAGWTAASFDHSVTGFLLTQGHANLQCAQCHINNNYSLTIAATDCGNSQCHLTTWQQTTTPVHSTSGTAFAASNCATCHTTAGWTAASFDHSVTGFTLTGTHMSPNPTPCASCHISNNYSLSSADCYGCHSAVFQGTTTIGGNVPNHITAGFPTTASACATCHPITTWSAGVFDHSATGFPLTQGHATVQCALCHINNNYSLQIAATDCGNSQCHLNDWNQTNNPPHAAAASSFPVATCSSCHTTAGWTTSTFNHNNTTFPLTGFHVTTACALCHVNNNYSGTLPTTCYNCHTADWNSTQTLGGSVPNHITSGFPQDCTQCHTTANWTTSTFNHNNTTFPLTGFHVTTACALCHVNNNYSGTLPTTCYNCHTADWNSTQTLGGSIPNHVTAGFPQDCTQCHTTANWTSATFNHNATTFPLTGFHVTTACALCHVNNNYSGTLPTNCYGCHLADYQSTATLGGSIPNHVAAAFPQDCTICHSTTNWTTSTFNHATTTFPLTGAHTTVACATCHTDSYQGTLPTTCDGCHDPLYQSTAMIGGSVPNHVSLSYPKTCDSCHTTTAWTGAVFDHSSTGFPLTGAHITTACNLCHLTTAVPPTDCYSCHTADWNSTQSLGGQVPNHVAAASAPGTPFLTSACSTCHTTTNWTGATFTHSWFPTSHGNAGGVCATCHTSATDYTVFQCIVCHGNSNSANFHHPNVGGYAYSNTACYACHPRGNGG